MERFIKGDIVIVPSPFSDLSANKKRSTFVLANMQGDDVILCQITSKVNRDLYPISISLNDF